MADWVTITDSQVDPDAPLTSELAYAWRDNPIAIAEGAPGAPKVVAEANAAPYVLAMQAATTANTFVTINGLEDMEAIRIDLMLAAVNTVAQLQFQFSGDNGATWGTQTTIHTIENASGIILTSHINLVTGVSVTTGVTGIGSTTSTSVAEPSLSIPANCTSFRWRTSAVRPGRMILQATGWRQQ